MNDITAEMDLSIAAGTVVSNALQLTRNLFCPYCADAYMFEFTLKDHLKKSHAKILKRLFPHQTDFDVSTVSIAQHLIQPMHKCPYCGAAFTLLGLVPKHISTYHGTELLKLWQQQTGNCERLQLANNHDPSILYAACSPGLSDIFDKMDTDGGGAVDATQPTDDNNDVDDDEQAEEPTLKSILKKTPNKTAATRIICSPASVAIRRSKSDAVKRSLSVRRELRFDPSTKRSPVAIMNSPPTKPSKSRKMFTFRNPFCFERRARNLAVNATTPAAATNQLITSTPINCLDDDGYDDDDDGEGWHTTKKNWKATIRGNRPLFFGAERFQCAHCKRSYENNADLVLHLRENHCGLLKRWLRPKYRCSSCGATFYSNKYLIRHCHIQHTPVKMGGTGVARNLR